MVSRALPLHGQAPAPAGPALPPVLAKGFRPFFLLAALWAMLSVPLWLLALAGLIEPGRYFGATYWHAHEMVFGFATAVVAGFLLTAVGNWTGRETVIGVPLLTVCGLWGLGRIAVTSGLGLAPWAIAVADLAFLPVLVVALARPLIAARNWRNFVMLAALLALFGANLTTHLDVLGVLPGWRRQGCLLGVDVVIFLIVVIAGRVMPMFTRNATGVATIHSNSTLDVLASVSTGMLLVASVVLPGGALLGGLALLASLLTAARAWSWGTRHTLKTPLLWVLHVGYAWVPLGFLLRAIAVVWPGLVNPSLATHALTAGAIGTLTLGMMARVALGHTGRPLVAPRALSVAFVLVTVAALLRVAGPFTVPAAYQAVVHAAGTLWSVGFVLYVVGYARILTMPRIDGKPG